ncbi:MAG: tetratricopeptide repeat protein [Cyanobacteriota bacterium]
MSVFDRVNNLYHRYFADNLKAKASAGFTKSLGTHEKKEALKAIKDSFELGFYGVVIEKIFSYLDSDPNNKEVKLILAQSYIHSEQIDLAENLLYDLLKQKPQSTEIRVYLSDCFIKKGKYHLSADKLKEVFKMEPDYENIKVKISESLYMYGKSLFKINSLTKALAVYKEALEYNESYNIFYAIGICHKDLKEYSNAIEIFLFVEEKFNDQLKSNLYNNLAEIYEILDNKKKAIECYEKAIQIEKEIYLIQYYKSKILMNQDYYKTALKNMININIVYPKFIKPLWSIIKNFEILNEEEHALEYYEKILAIEKDNSNATIEYAILHYKKGNIDIANSLLNAAYLTVSGQDIRVIKTLAKIDIKKNRPEDALKKLSKAFYLEPNDYEPYFLAAKCHLYSNSTYKAIEECNKAIELAPENIEIMLFLAEIYFKNKDLDNSISIYERIIEKDPTHKESYLLLAKIFMDSSKYKNAISILEKFVKKDKNNYEFNYNIGLCYYFSKEYDKAIDFFGRVLEKDKLPEIYLYTSYISKELNDLAYAIKNIEKYISFYPEKVDILLYAGKLCSEFGDKISAEKYFKEVMSLDRYNAEASSLWKNIRR